MELPQNIRKLDESVINRIAAGEIIQRPANAIKELIENSLDAKSTNIQISVKNGGLKLLQIQDNGVGIRKDNFDIVCERFTTSKLQRFEDLAIISTYGFRGEALASISHIAHLSITSKTASEVCAYRATYVDSKMQGSPTPVAGNQGTIISVEDLFYNMLVRKKALKSPSEEYMKIMDVVSKYAVHNSHVSFSLRKSGENNDIRTGNNSNVLENIRIIYGNQIARELIQFEVENNQLHFKAVGHVTNVNYSSKKMIFLLFINHRLVDCNSLKKCIDQVYATYLPKNSHPFVYLSVEMDSAFLDVNVHPTKHEVHFLNEEQVVESIVAALENNILNSNNSRVHYTQVKLPKVVQIVEEKSQGSQQKTADPKNFVRTDAKEQKLDKFLVRKSLDLSLTEEQFQLEHEKFLESEKNFEHEILDKTIEEKSKQKPKLAQNLPNVSRNKSKTELTSVMQLREEVEKNCHQTLRELFAQHVFVGAIDGSSALIQHNTKLYLCNTRRIAEKLLYQYIIFNFRHLGLITLSEKLPIKKLALAALDLDGTGWTPEDGNKEELAEKVLELLLSKREMLLDYFSLEIDSDGNLVSIPALIDDWMPDITGIPMYIIRLATEVNWDAEKECFANFSEETARFYAKVTRFTKLEKNDWKWVTEHVVYAAIKDYFMPSREFAKNSAVLEVANLPNLYRVFERC